MGSDYQETDYGKQDSFHNYNRSITTYRDKQNNRDIFFRKCEKCGHVQIGYSFIGYQFHGITWIDSDFVVVNDKNVNWKWRISHLKF